MSELTVASRFCGPPGTAHGGYVSGLFASHAPEVVRVRLERPVPLDVPLRVERRGEGRLELLHQGQRVARAEPAELELQPPAPPDYLDALDASRRYVAFEKHFFPDCFVCGTARARGDGLRIFAGATRSGDMVAAPWVPDTSLGHADGKIGAEFMWAALDCPGYFAARNDGKPMVLGEFTAHVDRRVHIDEPCVVIGWKIGASGRKHEVGTALFDEDGELCGRARATWIELR